MASGTALIVMDMQKDFLMPGALYYVSGPRDVVPSICNLIKKGRERGWHIIYIVRGHDASGADVEKFRMDLFNSGPGFTVSGTEGAGVLEEIAPTRQDIVIEKVRFSGFFATKLDLVLRRLAIDTIMLCGAQYPNCIRATAVDGISLDYTVVVCTDATWGSSPEVVAANISDMKNMGIKCLSTEEILTSTY